jgi:Asp-tRNA(Asn)/Glu-tRNA(Gln) amidotransferase B subunit
MPKKEEKSLEEIVNEVIIENTKALLEIQAGIRSSIDDLVSKVMRRAKVKVDPKKIRRLILNKL